MSSKSFINIKWPKMVYINLRLSRNLSKKRRWFSGRMLACQQYSAIKRKYAGGPGSIPGRRSWSNNFFDHFLDEFGILCSIFKNLVSNLNLNAVITRLHSRWRYKSFFSKLCSIYRFDFA